MEVVQRRHSGHLFQARSHRGQVDVGGSALQEDADRRPHELERARQDEQADRGGDDRVGVVPARRPHHDAGDDDSDGGEQIGQDLEVRALHVEAARCSPFRMKTPARLMTRPTEATAIIEPAGHGRGSRRRSQAS